LCTSELQEKPCRSHPYHLWSHWDIEVARVAEQRLLLAWIIGRCSTLCKKLCHLREVQGLLRVAGRRIGYRLY
ncbi:hypothetical protein Pmar_PMAR017529, partial [Perkinsus marinus ATCC 50983]